VLNGCPLDEKISEMHVMRRDGDALGALALVCLDNPMCPGTGHRMGQPAARIEYSRGGSRGGNEGQEAEVRPDPQAAACR